MTELGSAEQRLAAARARRDAAARVRNWSAAHDAYREQLVAERDIARLKGEQYAESFDLGVRWDTGAPLPHVVSGSHDTVVIFYLAGSDPAWDGTYATVVDPSDAAPAALGLVHFTGVYMTKFGGLNDEAIAGHSLHGRGLEAYEAHIVRSSRWIDEVEHANSVHPYHKAGWRERYDHFVLCFHDEMFECIAEAWRVETLRSSMAEAIQVAATRLL